MGTRVSFEVIMDEPERRETPPVSCSLTDSRSNKTGSWRYLRPRYQECPAPCQTACPAGTDIPRILHLVGESKLEEAYRTIRLTNPLPGVCGRVCPHPCEASCNRSLFDEPAAIQSVERYIADHFHDYREYTNSGIRNSRVAVVGSGPAGLSCAYFLAGERVETHLFEAHQQAGGMLRFGIPRFRLPADVLDREIQQIAMRGVEFHLGCPIGQDLSLDRLRQSFDAVFLATGAHQSRSLGIEGETGARVFSGLSFLRQINSGRPLQIGKEVLVVGGGNTAIDCARASLRLGSRPIVLYRRRQSEMPAIEDEIREAREEGIQFIFLASPVQFCDVDGGLQATFLRMRPGATDSSNRSRPVPIPGSEFNLFADSVITAIGEQADLALLSKKDRDRIEAGSRAVPSQLVREGLFLGGDARTGPGTVVEAVAAGRSAAFEILQYLNLEPLHIGERKFERAGSVTPDSINLDYFTHAPRARVARVPARQRSLGFEEVIRGMTADQALSEARRCFSCGFCNLCDNCRIFCPETAVFRTDSGYRIDLDYCKGCGICATECPRGVITLEQEEQ